MPDTDRPDPGRHVVDGARPGLGRALRTRFASVDEVVVPVAPSDAEIAGLRERAPSRSMPSSSGPSTAHRQPAQAALVRALAETGTPTVAVALRTPWDVRVYPAGVAGDLRPTRSCRTRSRRSRARSRARSGFPGRLAGRA